MKGEEGGASGFRGRKQLVSGMVHKKNMLNFVPESSNCPVNERICTCLLINSLSRSRKFKELALARVDPHPLSGPPSQKRALNERSFVYVAVRVRGIPK